MEKKYLHDGPRVLLVEGTNDCHLIWSLCKHYDVPDEVFGLYVCGSDKKVLQRLSALIAGSQDMTDIGVVLDADNPNLAGKWDAISNRLTNEGYNVPKTPIKDGSIISQEGKPTIGVWLMPDNDLDGMLEDFCARLAPPDALDYANNCATEAKKMGFSTFGNTHKSKATIHTFLAWQDEPGMPLGQAVTAKALDAKQPIAIQFSDFLKNLFLTNRTN
ncbi:DUF3226 domain-containing protein [Pseudomonas sp.]|uniref:DUF3226 domain-containing protein n=1 Tax=Pseudomonas sp. TaxID=306 RepID=UPI000E900DC5|nr:DUF3226 domain-containing protein [Pseudomonas sp.]HBP48653.1 hypothetical protein [Pseudomonas sp.]